MTCHICGHPIVDGDLVYTAHPKGRVHGDCRTGEVRAPLEQKDHDGRLIIGFLEWAASAELADARYVLRAARRQFQ